VRRLLKKTALSLVALLVVIALVEAGVRAIDPFGISYQLEVSRFLDPREGAVVAAGPPLVRTLRPGFDYRGSFVSHVNALGLRGDETLEAKPPGTFRVLFVGDSVTFGLGVDDALCFPALVQQELRAEGRDDVEVLNGGCPGWDGVQEAHWLKSRGLALAPDLVLVVFVPNDLPVDFAPEELARRETLRATWAWRFFDSSTLDWLRLKHLLWHFYFLKLQRDGALEGALGMADAGKDVGSKEAYLLVLDRMRKMSEARGAKLAVLAGFDRPWLREHCATASIPYESWLGGDLPTTPDEYRLSATDAHPNAAGHRGLAERALRLIRGQGLLPPPPR
jgi:lysophospholipase L1-like esterase